MLKCLECEYTTFRKFNLNRHHFNKHGKTEQDLRGNENDPLNVENVSLNIDNVNLNVENVSLNSENVLSDCENVSLDNKKIFNCKKCYKSYKTKQYLNNHESKCNGIDILTCSKCMFTFSNRKSKSRHIIANKCKPKSIMNYNNPNIINNTTNNNNNTTNNNNNITNNTTNNNTTNNIISNNNTNNININSYGNERIDYLTINKILEFMRTSPCSSIIPSYIEAKHFNKDFPENNNIKYENNTCYKLIDNKWKNTNINLLSNELLIKNSNEISEKVNNNKSLVDNEYKNEELLEYVQNHFNYLNLLMNNKLYKIIQTNIKDIIKSI